MPDDTSPLADSLRQAVADNSGTSVSSPSDTNPLADYLRNKVANPQETPTKSDNNKLQIGLSHEDFGHDLGATVRAIARGPASFAALPGDLGVMGYNKLTGSNVKTPSQGFEENLTHWGLPEANTPQGRLASDLVSGVTGGAVLGPAAIIPSVAGNLASGSAREMGASPTVQTVAGLAGGFTPSALSSLTRLGTGATEGLINGAKANFTQSGATNAGVKEFLSGANNTDVLKNSLAQLDNPNFNKQLVPGSNPTTFELTGDQGIGQFQRGLDTQNPAAAKERAAAQNSAQVNAISKLGQQGADVADTGNYFSNQLKAIQDLHDRKVQDLSDNINNQKQALQSSADQNTQNLANNLADKSQASSLTPEQHGEMITQGLDKIYGEKQNAENALWKVVDPDGNLVIDSKAIRDHAADLANQVEPELMDPKENAIYNVFQRQPETMPFQTVKTMKTALDSAINSNSIDNAPRARLIQLRNTLFDTIDNAATYVAKNDAADMASGAKLPEDTLFGRLQEEAKNFYGGNVPQKVAQAWQQNAPTAEEQLPTGATTGNGNAGNAPVREVPVSPVSGEQIQSPRGLPGNQGNPGLSQEEPAVTPPEGLTPIDNSSISGPYAQARAASREINQTYRTGPVGDILQRGTYGNKYNMERSLVPAKVWNAGKTQAEDSRAFFNAAQSDPDALNAYKDYAFSDMIRSATDPKTGDLNAGLLKKWQVQHGPALAEADKSMPGFSDQFKDTASAKTALDDHIQQSKAQINAYTKQADAALKDQLQQSNEAKNAAANSALGAFNKDKKTNVAISSALKKPDQFKEMVDIASRDPSGNATAGLREGVLNDLISKAQSNTESGTSGVNTLKKDAFLNWIKNNADMVEKSGLFSPEEVGNIRAIGDDLSRINRSISGSKLPGGSNTAQDTIASSAVNGKTSIFHELMNEGMNLGAAGAGWKAAQSLGFSGPMGGAIGWLGAKTLSALKSRALATKQDVIRRMVYDPEFANEMLKQLPADKPVPVGMQNKISNSLNRYGAAGIAGNMAGNVAANNPVPQSHKAAPVKNAFTPEFLQNQVQKLQGVQDLTVPPKTTPDLLKNLQGVQDLSVPAVTHSNGALQAIKQAESAGNPNAKNPNSTASGPYQFVNKTWQDMVSKYGKQTGITLADKANPQAQEIMANYLLNDNAKALQASLGRQPTTGELYMAHVLGADGAKDLISAYGTGRPANTLFPASVIKANRNIFMQGTRPRTVEEVYKLIESKVA